MVEKSTFQRRAAYNSERHVVVEWAEYASVLLQSPRRAPTEDFLLSQVISLPNGGCFGPFALLMPIHELHCGRHARA